MAAEIRIIVGQQGSGSAVKDARADVKDLGETADKAGGGFSSLREVAVGALREVGALAVNALASAATAVAGFMRDSVVAASSFQDGMAEFQAVAGKGVDTAGLEKFHDLFLQLGKDLPVSTADVQKAAIELVKGGIDPATVAAGGLEQAIKFAGAAMDGDLAAAAETSAKIVGGWADVTATAQEKAELLTHATDLLTKAANASTVDVRDLSLGLYNVQGTAKAAGLSLDETTTALAELAPRFSNANTAGTAFRNFLVRLQPTTKPATEAMQNLGLMTTSTTKIMQFLQERGIKPLGTDLDTLGNQFTEFAATQGWTAKETEKIWGKFSQSSFFDDMTGEFVGVAKASDLLRDATKDLTDAQRLQAFQTIFGNDAMNAAAAFAEMGADGYTAMAQALENANGVSENAALKATNLSQAWKNFQGTIEMIQIVVGEALLPVLTQLFNEVLQPAINTMATFTEAILGSDAAFAQLSPTLQGIIVTVTSLAAMLQPAIDALIASFTSTQGPIGSFVGALMQISPVFSVIYGVVSTVMPQIQALVGSVLGTIITYFTAHGAAMLAQVTLTWQMFRETLVALTGAISLVVQAWLAQIMIFWTNHGTEIMAYVGQVWAMINEIIQVALLLIQATVVPAFQLIAGFISAHGAEIQAILLNNWNQIKAIINAALILIKGIITTVLLLVKGDFAGAWEAIKAMSAAFVKELWSFIKAGLDNIWIIWQPFWELVKHFFEAVLDGLVGWVIQTFQGIKNAIVGFAGLMRSSASGVGDAIVQGMIDGIKSGAGAIVRAAKDAAMAAYEAAKDFLGIGSPSKVFAQSIGLPIAQGMAQGITKGAPMVAGAAQSTAGAAVAGGRSQVYNSSFTYAPTINGGGMDAPLDYGLAASLAGV